MKYCQYCGSEIEDNQKFCGNCGGKIEQDIPEEEPLEESTESVESSQTDAKIPHWTQRMFGILAIILGIFGGVGGIVFGILGLTLGGKRCEYRRRYINGIVLGGLFLFVEILAYIGPFMF